MRRIDIVDLSTGHTIKSIPLRSHAESYRERVLMGVLRSLDLERYSAIERSGVGPKPGPAPDFKSMRKLCPKCDRTKPVLNGFGLRTVTLHQAHGVLKRKTPQSYCRACRNTINYHKRHSAK